MDLRRTLPMLGMGLLLSVAPSLCAVKKKAQHSPRKSAGTPASARASSAPKTKAGAGAGKSSSHRRRGRQRVRGQKAPTADRIREIQAALAREGAFQGAPNGKWDAAAVEAMKRFQAAQGLSPTGKLDALSLQKLGLGSQVAGLAAPRPPAPPVPSSSLRHP